TTVPSRNFTLRLASVENTRVGASSADAPEEAVNEPSATHSPLNSRRFNSPVPLLFTVQFLPPCRSCSQPVVLLGKRMKIEDCGCAVKTYRFGSIATVYDLRLLPLILQERRYSGHVGTHTSCRFCCKSLFAQVTKNSPGRTRDFRVRMGGPHRLTENS